MVQAKYRTYGQFRGYATVTTRTGQSANNPQTETETLLPGHERRHPPIGTSSVTLTDSPGGSHDDSDQLAGDPLETTTYLGDGGPVESSTITSYWVSGGGRDDEPAGLPALTANMTGPAETWTRTALTDGGETDTWSIPKPTTPTTPGPATPTSGCWSTPTPTPTR